VDRFVLGQIVLQEGLPGGSIFGFGDSALIPYGGSWESVGSASFALAVDGDSVILYCRNEERGDYHHLGGLIVGQWSRDNNSEMSASDSQLPESMRSVGAVEIEGGWDSVLYTGMHSGTKAGLLTALADTKNWEGSNSARYVYSGGNFEIIGIEGSYSEQIASQGDGAVTLSVVRLIACLSVAVLAWIHHT
jgi:hypothetical protein